MEIGKGYEATLIVVSLMLYLHVCFYGRLIHLLGKQSNA